MEDRKLTDPNLIPADPAADGELDVKRLISAFQAGDQHAYDQIVKRYRGPVTALAYQMTHDYDEAADVAQDVFVKMARNINRYDPKRRFYTWLYRITVNAGIDHIRRSQRHQHETLDNIPEVEERSDASPEMSYLRQQIQAHIRDATSKLNEKQRSAFILRDVGGRKVDDVAGIMNMPEATVRWYLHRARARIRKELIRRCPHLLIMLGMR